MKDFDYLPSNWKDRAQRTIVNNDLVLMEASIETLMRWHNKMNIKTLPEETQVLLTKEKVKSTIMPNGERQNYSGRLQAEYWTLEVIKRWSKCRRIRREMEENIKHELQELLIERCEVLDLDCILDQELYPDFFEGAQIQVIVQRWNTDPSGALETRKNLKKHWKRLETDPKRYNQFLILEIPEDPRDPTPARLSTPAVAGWGWWDGTHYWVDKDCKFWHASLGYIQVEKGYNWWPGSWTFNNEIANLSKLSMRLNPLEGDILSWPIGKWGSLEWLQKFNPEMTIEDTYTTVKVSWEEVHGIVKRWRDWHLDEVEEVVNQPVNPPEWVDEPPEEEANLSVVEYTETETGSETGSDLETETGTDIGTDVESAKPMPEAVSESETETDSEVDAERETDPETVLEAVSESGADADAEGETDPEPDSNSDPNPWPEPAPKRQKIG